MVSTSRFTSGSSGTTCSFYRTKNVKGLSLLTPVSFFVFQIQNVLLVPVRTGAAVLEIRHGMNVSV